MKALFEDLRALHSPYKIYDECGHDHHEGDIEAVYIEEIGMVCGDGFQYEICRECCMNGGDFQSEECQDHDHGKDKPICATVAILDKHTR